MCLPVSKLRALATDRRASVAVIFAVSAFVLVGVVGLGIDYARALSVRQKLQNVVDNALLAAAPRAAEGDDAVSGALSQFLALQWADGYNGAASLKIEAVKSANKTVSATVAVDVPTLFMRVLGVTNVNVSVSAEAMVGDGDAEIALVLDNTGSMTGAKLDALKAAAKSLIDIVYTHPKSAEHVRVGLVPFSQYVNVGIDNRNASWMDVPLDTSSTKQECWDDYPVTGKSNCRIESFTVTVDGVQQTLQGEVCDYTYGPPAKVCVDATTTTMWHGCVGSRSYPLNVRDEQYTSRIPGIMNATCTAPITPLTNDSSKMRDVIDAMVATGNTYIPEGLMWGWRVLSPEAPFDQAGAYTAKGSPKRLRKILVLMTDGANTNSPIYPDHNGSDTALANTLTLEACAQVKAAGIEIFTIAFDVIETGIRDVLTTCASSPVNYFEAVTEQQLRAVFESIAQGVVALRLSR